jgi:hypothetical protein
MTEGKIVKPRPAAATSMPEMLTMFPHELDAVMLETFTVKQHLDTEGLSPSCLTHLAPPHMVHPSSFIGLHTVIPPYLGPNSHLRHL